MDWWYWYILPEWGKMMIIGDMRWVRSWDGANWVRWRHESRWIVAKRWGAMKMRHLARWERCIMMVICQDDGMLEDGMRCSHEDEMPGDARRMPWSSLDGWDDPRWRCVTRMSQHVRWVQMRERMLEWWSMDEDGWDKIGGIYVI